MWSCAQGRSSHFGFGKYLFDKIRTSRALKVISSFVKPGEENVPTINNGKDCYYSVAAIKITALM